MELLASKCDGDDGGPCQRKENWLGKGVIKLYKKYNLNTGSTLGERRSCV